MLLSRYDFLRANLLKSYDNVIAWSRKNNVNVYHKDIHIIRKNGSVAISYTAFIDSDEVITKIKSLYKINNARYHMHYDKTQKDISTVIESKEPALEHIFTFGSGQQYENHFIAIYNTNSEEARKQMFDRFEDKWSMHYEPPNARKKAGIDKWNLKQIQ